MKTFNLFMALVLVVGLALVVGPVPVAGAVTLNIDDTNNTVTLTGMNAGMAVAIRGNLTNTSSTNYPNTLTAVFFREVSGDIALADVTFSWWAGAAGWQPAGSTFKPTNYPDYQIELNIGGGGFPLPAGFVGAGTWIRAIANRNFGTVEAKAITYLDDIDSNGKYDFNETIISELGVIDTDIQIDLLGFDLETVYVDDNWAACDVGNPATNTPTQEVASGKFCKINAFDKIQDGISNVYGSTVNVAAGTYTPGATIAVNKSVTLQGPQASVDPRPSAGTTRTPGSASEAVVDGGGTLSRIFRITASDVVLDGLEIRSATGDMIDSPSGAGISNVALRYNIIRDALGDEGVQLRDCTDCVVEYNHVFDIAQDGINLCCGSTSGTIQSNEVHANSSENAAIYVYESTNTTIQCNLVYDVFDNDGIKLGSKNGGDAALSGGSIRYNEVHGTIQDGISVYMSDTLVDGNEVYRSTSENGAIYVAHEVANITIVDNTVHDNLLDASKRSDPGGIMIGKAVNAATVAVNNNNITGNLVNGVTNEAVALLNAQGNWWGAADGPSSPGGSGSGDGVSTNVDFSFWLTGPAQPQGVNPCPEEPTAITLASFSAQAGADGVALAWETGTEIDNAGFNLYRALTQDGPWTQINGALIAAEGDAVSGGSYSFVDTPDYGTFYYKLEDVDYYGVSTLHGPVKATVARPLRRPLYRPALPEF